MNTYRVEVSPKQAGPSPRISKLYFLRGTLGPDDVQRLARELLADPVTEDFFVEPTAVRPAPNTVEITLLPGVTDPPAESLLRAAPLIGVTGLAEAATGRAFRYASAISRDELNRLAENSLANGVIQRYAVNATITPPFIDEDEEALPRVLRVDLRESNDDELMAVSVERRLSLDLTEMRAVRDYAASEDRMLTDAEIETIAQTWSEHCVHKTFKALIDVANGAGAPAEIDGLLTTYIRAATEAVAKPWVKSAFVDNAGIIAFNDAWDLAFKVETHNHPSALEPFGGATTGVGGVVRDVMGVSAKPIAVTDVLCFGPLDLAPGELPAGVLAPRRVYDGVVRGIEDYGNKMGLPTVNGAIHFHRGYTANPLVYAGCVGLLPSALNRERNRVPHPAAGDYIVVVGGRTGRDGLRGATFSSMELDGMTCVVAGSAVQIGHPIHEKQALEALLRARDAGLYRAITDCGAGGLSSAVGEMARGLGAVVRLESVPLKYRGLQPWEIWLSEAQERMVLAVPPDAWDALRRLCDEQNIDAVRIGEFEASNRLRLFYRDIVVGDLDLAFLYDGLPRRRMTARPAPPEAPGAPAREAKPRPAQPAEPTAGDALLKLLGHPNIRSKEDVVRTFDHEVQGRTAVKPYVGVANHGPSDACVLAIPDGAPATGAPQGIALSNGLCPQYGERDPYSMAFAAVDEAFRNAVAVGADPDRVALLDNFCWGNPNLPDRLWSLVECARGCHDAALAYGAPFISGKDSLNNEYTGDDGKKHAIPGTILISALGIVPSVDRTASMDFKAPGNAVYVVGDTRAELGQSHYAAIAPGSKRGALPVPQPVAGALPRLRAVHAAMSAGLVEACHDCSEGGLAVALAEMCIAGRLGASVNLRALPRAADVSDDAAALFSETLCRFVIEVRPENEAAFEVKLVAAGVPHARIGAVSEVPALSARGLSGAQVIDTTVEALERAWRGDIAPSQLAASPPAAGARATPQVSSRPRVLILHANGTNRDHDAAMAVELAGGAPEIVHVNALAAGGRSLDDFAMLVLPGGFSYGDDLGAGVLWALDARGRLGERLARFVESGRPVLGICNGFQALVKAGLLPGAGRRATLTHNVSGKFECRWVYLAANPASPCVFTRGLDQPVYCPVAHGEGRLAVDGDETLDALRGQGLIALAYVGPDGAPAGYPANPNGSALDIAGLCNARGNVLGLMPHPENHIFAWQHPRARRGEAGGSGLRLFVNGLAYARS